MRAPVTVPALGALAPLPVLDNGDKGWSVFAMQLAAAIPLFADEGTLGIGFNDRGTVIKAVTLAVLHPLFKASVFSVNGDEGGTVVAVRYALLVVANKRVAVV